jgi:hypothetical protein
VLFGCELVYIPELDVRDDVGVEVVLDGPVDEVTLDVSLDPWLPVEPVLGPVVVVASLLEPVGPVVFVRVAVLDEPPDPPWWCELVPEPWWVENESEVDDRCFVEVEPVVPPVVCAPSASTPPSTPRSTMPASLPEQLATAPMAPTPTMTATAPNQRL